MAETTVIERSPVKTVLRTGANGQTLAIPNLLPILPIRNIVVFPGTVMPLNVGRPKSKALLDEVMPGEKLVGVVTQKNAETEDPAYLEAHKTGDEEWTFTRVGSWGPWFANGISLDANSR